MGDNDEDKGAYVLFCPTCHKIVMVVVDTPEAVEDSEEERGQMKEEGCREEYKTVGWVRANAQSWCDGECNTTPLPEIERCPFCGNSAVVEAFDGDHDNPNTSHYVRCTNRNCRASQHDDEREPFTTQQAIERWNRRHRSIATIGVKLTPEIYHASQQLKELKAAIERLNYPALDDMGLDWRLIREVLDVVQKYNLSAWYRKYPELHGARDTAHSIEMAAALFEKWLSSPTFAHLMMDKGTLLGLTKEIIKHAIIEKITSKEGEDDA